MNKSEDKWTHFHADKIRGNYPTWPVEAMVKVLFGDYLRGVKPNFNSDTKVLDVGCGFGNNLLPFLVKGCKCYGIEISEEIAKLTQNILINKGFSNAIIRKGNNQSIPFGDKEFDLIVSNNVIHYEKDEANYLKALGEYSRVLKNGGCLYLMTVGPGHDIYQKARVVGPHRFEIQDYDFRNNEQFFYLSNLKYLKYYLNKYFIDIELGQVTEKLMKVNLDFLVAYCRKK